MITNNLVWFIGGEAGSGIDKAANIFARTISRGGLYLFGNFEFPSLIRGGHNTFAARISDKKIHSSVDRIDLLIALNHETIEIHSKDLQKGSAVLYDADEVEIKKKDRKEGVFYFYVPFKKIALEEGGNILFRNMAAIFASLAFLDYDLHLFDDIIHYQFGKKGKEIVEKNIKVTNSSFNYVKKHYPKHHFQYRLRKKKAPKRMLINGNTSLALGAIQGGVKFVASYPMTPATSVFQYLAAQAKKYNIIVKHTEDEIAAINMIIGAGYLACRSLASTSGGGFALMVEALGMSGVAEVPIVVTEVQRPGPSTGLPTQTGQGDLLFMINAAQGDFPFIVLAPGDTEQCFYLAFDAMNLAEKYQCPVGILSDKYLADSMTTVEPFETKNLKIDRGALLTEKEASRIKNYKRYEFTKTGISKRAIPGYKNTIHHQTSYEHDEYGDFTENPDLTEKMNEKRMRKMEFALKELSPPKLIGSKNAEITFVTWGSSVLAVREACEILNQEGIKANYLQIIYMSPFHTKEVTEILKKSKTKIMVEQNVSGQLAQIIKRHTGISMNHLFLKYNGRPIVPGEIIKAVKKIQKNPNCIRNVLHYASS